MLTALLLLIGLSTANASSAEALRLQQEMGRLAARDAWTGVERAFVWLMAAEVPLSAGDWTLAAEAALHRGDLAAARDRYARAVALREDRTAIETLYRIDFGYTKVALAGARELVVAAPPFDPEGRAAFAFAVADVEAGRRFDGFLPPGTYRYGDRVFTAAAGESLTLTVTPAPARRRAGDGFARR